MEEWRSVVGYEGLYEVSNLGNLRTLHWKGGDTIKPMTKIKRKDGYLVINLSKDGKKKSKLIHRIVAEAFIPKEQGKDFVNHKDENRTNNRVDNLEWCNKSYNQLYSMNLHPERKDLFTDNLRDKETGKIGSRYTKKGVAHTHFEKVKQSTRDGEYIATYNTISEAALCTGDDIGHIYQACRANARTDRIRKLKYKRMSKGFVWEFAE